MAYFPMFIAMENVKVLVVGGGTIATEKLEKIVDFTKEVTVIAAEISPEAQRVISDHCLTLYQRPYRKGDIESFDIVIVATDTVELHRAIYEESRPLRILVNSVDNTDYCDFIFPSYIKEGDLTIAFSTSGASPAFAKQIKQYFRERIPENIDDFLQNMKHLRTKLPKGRERMQKFEEMVREYMEKNFKS